MESNNPFTGDPILCETPSWAVVLSWYQYHLGRLIIYAKAPAERVGHLNQAVQLELFALIGRLERALEHAFQPDLFNIACLRNEVRWMHWHLIPRYATPRELAGQQFVDERFGQNYTPYPKAVAPVALRTAIAQAILDQLGD